MTRKMPFLFPCNTHNTKFGLKTSTMDGGGASMSRSDGWKWTMCSSSRERKIFYHQYSVLVQYTYRRYLVLRINCSRYLWYILFTWKSHPPTTNAVRMIYTSWECPRIWLGPTEYVLISSKKNRAIWYRVYQVYVQYLVDPLSVIHTLFGYCSLFGYYGTVVQYLEKSTYTP